MKRRDLEDLKNKQSQKQQKVRDKYKFILLGIGAIALLGGIIYMWQELPRILLRNQVAADCKKIEEAWNTLSTFGALQDEVMEKGILASLRKESIDTARLYQIANEIDAEYERMKTISIRDTLLSRYYLMSLGGMRAEASEARKIANEPLLVKPTEKERELGYKAIEGTIRIGGRCQGMSDEELERSFREKNKQLDKQIEQNTKEFNEKQK